MKPLLILLILLILLYLRTNFYNFVFGISVQYFFDQFFFSYIDSMREVYFPIEGEVVFKRQQIKFN